MLGDTNRSLERIGKQTRFGQRGRKLCGAKSKQTGNPCQQPAMKNGRCRLHGGKTPKRDAIQMTPEKIVARLAKRELGLYKAEIRSLPPPLDWPREQELLATGLLHKASNDIVRYELRRAYASYSKGEMPWIYWRQTLEALGLVP